MSNNEKLRELKLLGCDTETAIKRVGDDESFYLAIATEFIAMKPLDEIILAVSENNSEKVFSAAHKLKGTLGNLGFPQYKAAIEIVEISRVGSLRGVADKLKDMITIERKLEAILC